MNNIFRKKIISFLFLGVLLISKNTYANEEIIVIKTAEELQNINDNLNACYVLENDIDLTGVTWTPIGNVTNKFMGSFDGKGHTISNLTGDFAQPNVGVFGVATNSVIKNINLKDINRPLRKLI